VNIIVVGAGISGLYASFLLQQSGHQVTVLEAATRSGGRILSIHDRDGGRIELGAELAYAPESRYMQMLSHLGVGVRQQSGDSYFILDGELHKRGLKQDNTLNHLLDTLDSIEETAPTSFNDISVKTFFQRLQFYPLYPRVIEAFCCEYGASAAHLGIRQLAEEEGAWKGGDEEFFCDQPMIRIVEFLEQQLLAPIQFSKQVKHIEYESGVKIYTTEGECYDADIALISVGLGILKSDTLSFSPPLPQETRNAIACMGIQPGIKVILNFKHPWWPQHLLTIEGGTMCYEYLASAYTRKPTLTAFIMDEQARAVSHLTQEQLIECLLGELKNIGSPVSRPEDLDSYCVKDWGRDPLHLGAYSYPAVGSSGARTTLSKPVNKQIYFIGEACNQNGHAATIHGAMETAEFAVNHINALNNNSSTTRKDTLTV